MQAVQADWDLIQALYQKGVTPNEISKQTGVKAETVSTRAHRRGWRKTLYAAREIMKALEEKPEGKSKAESKSEAQSQRARAGLADILVRSVEQIQTMTLKTPSQALRVNGELESVARNCKTVFGWDTAGQAPAVRISIMASSSLVQVNASGEIVAEPTPEPVPIEIASEVVPEQPKPEE